MYVCMYVGVCVCIQCIYTMQFNKIYIYMYVCGILFILCILIYINLNMHILIVGLDLQSYINFIPFIK